MISNQMDFLQLAADEQVNQNVIVPSDPRWSTAIKEFKQANYFGFDLETYGAEKGDALNPWTGEIRLISVGLPSGLSLVADLGGWEDDKDQLIADLSSPDKPFLPVLFEKLKCNKTKTIGHNLKFDLLFFKVKFGAVGRCIRDTMLMSQVYWAGLKGVGHGLKDLSFRLGFEVDKTEQSSNYGFYLRNAQINYSAKDSLVVIDIWKKLGKMLQDDGIAGSALAECLALPGFVEMEFNGMPVNYEKLQSVLKQYQDAAKEVLKPFSDRFPNLNPDSPKQVTDTLNRELGLNLTGSSQDDLAPYWDKPEIKALSLWRTITTHIDYLKNTQKCFFGGAVRGVYRQIAPKGFGRSTCGDDRSSTRNGINLQNPPAGMPPELKSLGLPKVRSIFCPPPGRALLVADLSSAHARIATEISKDKALIGIYAGGADMHSVTAAALTKLQGKNWTHEYINKARKDKSNPDHIECAKLRQAAKPTFYGSLNAQGWRTLQQTALTDAGVEMTEDDAKQAMQAWRSAYKDLYQFQLSNLEESNKREYTFKGIQGVFGEVRGLSNRRIFMLKHKSDFRPNDPPSIKLTDCSAFTWTSSEADIIKLALGQFVLECDQHPEWEAHLSNIAHDELDVTCKEEFALAVAKCLWVQMAGAMHVFIKSIPVTDSEGTPDTFIVKSWADK